MANPTCSAADFVTNAACYNGQHINVKQQKALMVYAKALELKAINGTDYTASLTTMLEDTAADLAIDPDRIRAALINIYFVNAAAAGATVPGTIDAKLQASACLTCVSDLHLDLIDVLLTCKLGVHKAYPQ